MFRKILSLAVILSFVFSNVSFAFAGIDTMRKESVTEGNVLGQLVGEFPHPGDSGPTKNVGPAMGTGSSGGSSGSQAAEAIDNGAWTAIRDNYKLQRQIGFTSSDLTSRDGLSELVKSGLLTLAGEGKNKRYYLTEKGWKALPSPIIGFANYVRKLPGSEAFYKRLDAELNRANLPSPMPDFAVSLQNTPGSDTPFLDFLSSIANNPYLFQAVGQEDINALKEALLYLSNQEEANVNSRTLSKTCALILVYIIKNSHTPYLSRHLAFSTFENIVSALTKEENNVNRASVLLGCALELRGLSQKYEISLLFAKRITVLFNKIIIYYAGQRSKKDDILSNVPNSDLELACISHASEGLALMAVDDSSRGQAVISSYEEILDAASKEGVDSNGIYAIYFCVPKIGEVAQGPFGRSLVTSKTLEALNRAKGYAEGLSAINKDAARIANMCNKTIELCQQALGESRPKTTLAQAPIKEFPNEGLTGKRNKGVGPAMGDGSSGGKAAEAVSTPAEHKLSRAIPFIAGNWKMEKGTKEEAVALLREIAEKIKDTTGAEIVISPSTIHIIVVSNALKELERNGEISKGIIKIAAQNVSGVETGAQTGRTGILQLKDARVTYVIIGHSEQRRDKSSKINEVERAAINTKVKLALANGLIPILCVGESLEEREAGQATNIVELMVKEDLEGLSAEDMRKVVIAYEPVWAIGTNKNATPEQAQEMNAFVRKLVETIYSPEAASQIIILYGGSVKPDNAQELYAQADIDGFLIGGASLKADGFASIAQTAVKENTLKLAKRVKEAQVNLALENITNLMSKASSVLKISDARETVLGSFGLTQETLTDDSTAYVFSTAAVFDENGLGVLIPALANRGVQIAVVVKEGNTAQDKVIAQINSAITDSENKLMIYESVKEAVDDLRDNNGFEKITYVATSEEAPEGELLNVDKVIRVEQILKSLGKITTLQEILGDFKSNCEIIGTRA